MASKGINKVILVGNCGGDPEVRYSQSGTAMTTLTMATSESWKDKSSGEQQERTEWHRVKFFGRLAEIVGEYVKKGRQIYVEGKLRTDKYDKEGVVTYSTYIVGDEMQMLGQNPDGNHSSNRAPSEDRGGSNAPNRSPASGSSAPQNRGGGGSSAPFPDSSDPFPEGMEDDIPFATQYSTH